MSPTTCNLIAVDAIIDVPIPTPPEGFKNILSSVSFDVLISKVHASSAL